MANQPLTDGEGGGSLGACIQTVGGGSLQPARFVIEHIERRNTSTEQRHEARKKALTELGQRVRSLELSDDIGGAGFDPSLLVYRRGTLLEHFDRSGKAARFVRGVGKRNGLRVIAGRDGLDRAFERLNRVDDAAKREETEQAGQQERRRVGGQYIPAGFFNRRERGSSRAVSKAPVVFDPLAGYLAERDTCCSNVGLERGEGIVLPPFLGQRHHVPGFDDVTAGSNP